VDPVHGVPSRLWRKNKLEVARREAAAMVERLIPFLDHVAGDPDTRTIPARKMTIPT
jgi:hypothetical protein